MIKQAVLSSTRGEGYRIRLLDEFPRSSGLILGGWGSTPGIFVLNITGVTVAFHYGFDKSMISRLLALIEPLYNTCSGTAEYRFDQYDNPYEDTVDLVLRFSFGNLGHLEASGIVAEPYVSFSASGDDPPEDSSFKVNFNIATDQYFLGEFVRDLRYLLASPKWKI